MPRHDPELVFLGGPFRRPRPLVPEVEPCDFPAVKPVVLRLPDGPVAFLDALGIEHDDLSEPLSFQEGDKRILIDIGRLHDSRDLGERNAAQPLHKLPQGFIGMPIIERPEHLLHSPFTVKGEKPCLGLAFGDVK